MPDFSTEVFKLMDQRLMAENARDRSLQSMWGASLRSCANKDSGLLDIKHVADFHNLSDSQRREQYEQYQKSLECKVLAIVRAHNALKYEQRQRNEIKSGAEYCHILFFNPFERLGYGHTHTLFQRGGTTADNILRMTGKNIAVINDSAVKKMGNCNILETVLLDDG